MSKGYDRLIISMFLTKLKIVQKCTCSFSTLEKAKNLEMEDNAINAREIIYGIGEESTSDAV